ncbi:DUF6541 family protein [Schumannella soli]|uniref:Uncharacterized protein n=1 Tax=Schumannella soli TaxID=2590779 RepID=A0A506Y3T6_9MICO|nr:DUF6541 family protein [Schumannella soli]TPW77236.1 hypothetical protein FJ657_00555 [Schumannella soli]
MSAAVALIAGLALLVIPGGALAAAIGLRGIRAVAFAAPFSIAVMSIFGVVDGVLDLRFAWWHPALAAVAAALVVAAARRRLPVGAGAIPRGRRPSAGAALRRDLPAIAAVVIASATVSVIGAIAIGGADHVSQSYDGLFHLNAVAWIVDTGDASSFHLYRITHPGEGNEFYPAAWHALAASIVQLTGSSVPVAANAAWVTSTATLWMPGLALLAAEILPGASRRRAAVVAPLLAIGAGGFPLLLLAWGTLYPTGMAYALLPAGLALSVRFSRWLTLRTRRRLAGDPVMVTSAALWLAASGFSHPRSLFSLIALLLPLVVATVAGAARRLWRHRAQRRRILLVAAASTAVLIAAVTAGAVYVYRAFDVAQRPISDHLNGGPATARSGLGATALEAIGLAPLDPNLDTRVLAPAIGLALLAIVGAVLCARSARLRWLVGSWALAVVLFSLAAGSNSDLAKIATGLWYKDKFRLFPLVVLTAVLLATVAATAIIDAVLRRVPAGDRARRRLVLVAGSALVVLITAAGGQLPAVASSIGVVFDLPDHQKNGALIDRDEYRLLERLPNHVPRDAVVAGNPWNGSALSWAVGGRRTLFPHLTGIWSPDATIVANSLGEAQSDPAVCAAVRRLDLEWVVADPGLLWGSPPEASFYAGIDRAVTTPGVLELVDHQGDAALYRIVACG